jgi:hypothetical protein
MPKISATFFKEIIMKIKLQNVRLSFPHLFEAKAGDDGGEKKFSAGFLIDPSDKQIKMIEDAMVQVAKDKWGAKWETVYKAMKAGDKLALHDGDAKAQYAGYEGMMFINANNPARPLILDRDKTPLTAEDGKPYGGCYVNVTLDLWAQDNKFGKRINAGLGGVQFVKDGDRFGGGTQGEESDFDELEDGADAEDIV